MEADPVSETSYSFENTILGQCQVILISRSRVLEKLIVHSASLMPHLLWNSKGSLPHSQEPATGPYPEPDESNPLSNNTNSLFINQNLFYYVTL
jgi:hypothetical protein